GDLLGRQDVVNGAGACGAAGHAVVFCAGVVLSEGNSTLGLDFGDAQGAIGSGTGKHDADGAAAVLLGEGAHEVIDGHVNAVGFLAGPQLQRVVGDGHGGIGGNHEEMIGHDVHAVLDFGDFDLGVLGQQVGEDAVVFGVQMLDENVGHAGV